MLNLNITRPAAAYLKEKLNLSVDEEAIALFGLQALIYSTINLLTICFVGWLFGCFWTTLVATLSAGLLRLFSGGAHSKSPLTCAILGMIVALLLGKAALIIAPIFTYQALLVTILIGVVVSLIIVLLLAPVDSPAKPIISLEYKRKMRFLSLLIVILIAAGQVVLISWNEALTGIVLSASLGTWWQTFTLTKAGHRFATLLDNFIVKEGKRSETSL
ncbi:MAG TPA: accessory gene regulator B family protein [Syntrophomonadaceae bacterium]|nr:accessory gene regulator B family protein [Syntrophomonadaceae bacterium]